MAQWYAVIDSATGRAVSFGTQVANPLPPGLSAVAIDHQPQGRERWDPALRAVVILPQTAAEQKLVRLAELRAKGWTNLTAAEREEARGLVFDLGGAP